MQTGAVPVVLAPEPFTPRVETLEACAGQSVSQILLAAVQVGFLPLEDLPRTEVYIDGVRLEDRAAALDFVPAPGQVVNVAVLPHGGGGRGRGNKFLQTVLNIAIIAVSFWIGGPAGPLAAIGKGATNALIRATAAAAVATAGSAVSNALFGPKSELDGSSSSATRYSLQGQQNEGRRGRPMPLVLGQRRVWFDLASTSYTETIGDDVFIHVIYGLHYGPCTLDISSLKLGETLFSALPEGDVTYELALTPGPRAFTIYPMRVFEEGYTNELNGDTGEWVVHTTAEDCEKIQVDVSWPQGLFYTNEKGASLVAGSHVLVEYRPAGSGTWLQAPLDIVSGPAGPLPQGSIYQELMTKEPLNVTREWVVTKGQYEVRMKRLPHQAGMQGTFTDATFWVAMRTLEQKTPIVDQTLACMALKVKASGTINGSLPQVSGVVTPICPIYSGGNWNTEAATSNPAALARWLMTGPAAAKPLTAEDIDASCATQYQLIEDRSWQAGLLLKDGESQEDALVKLGAAGRFGTYYNGSKLCFVGDWEKPIARQLFTGRNVRGYRYKRIFPDPVHAVRVNFFNLDRDSQADELVVYNDGYTSANAELFETLDLGFACQSPRAYKEGRVWLAKHKLQVETHEWTSSLDALISTYGDRVRLRHAASLYGISEARVQFRRWSGGLVTGVRIDTEVELEAGKSYAIDIRRPDQLILAEPIVTAGARTRDITFPSPLSPDAAPLKGDLLAIGELLLVTEDLELQDVRPQSNGEVQLVGRAYRAADIMAAETGPIPDLQTNLSVKQGAPTPRIRGSKGSPEGVTVSFDITGQRTSPVARFTARWRYTPGVGQDSSWQSLADLGPAARTVKTPPVADAAYNPDSTVAALRVDVEIRTVLDNGDVSEPGQALGIEIRRDVAAVENFTVLGVIRSSPDGSSFPAAQISADPIDAGLIKSLVVEFRPSIGGSWAAAGAPLDAANPRTDFTGVKGGETYDFRARWKTTDGWYSPWAYENSILIPAEGFVSYAVSKIGGLTPAEWQAQFEAQAALANKNSQAAMEFFLRAIDERSASVQESYHNGVRVKRIVVAEDEAFEEGDFSLLKRTILMGEVVDNGTAFQFSETTLKVSPTETWGVYKSAIAASLASNSAAITSEATTRATADTALATSLSTVSSTVAGHTSSISVLQAATNGLSAQWNLTVSAGRVAGISTYAGSTLSSIVFYADQIGFTNGLTDKFPLAIVGGVLKATGMEIDTIKADTIVTNHLVGGAVSKMAFSVTSGLSLDLYYERTVHSFYYTCDGGKMLINLFAVWTQYNSGATGVRVRMYRDGSLILDSSFPSTGPYADNKSLFQYDQPGAGTYLYTITMNTLTGITNVISGSCAAVVTELKKAG